MKYVLIFSSYFLICVHSAFGQSKQYRLDELRQLALENNPQFQANTTLIQAGMKQVDYLKKDNQPQLFVDLSASRWKYLLPQKAKLLGNSLNDLYADLRVNQLVYDWGKNALQKNYADKSVDLDRNYGRKLLQTITYSLAKTYLEILKTKRTIQIQEEAVKQLKEHQRNAEALYNVGKVSYLDIIRTKVQIELTLNELTKTTNQLAIKKNDLNTLCGSVINEAFDVEDNADILWKQLGSQSYHQDELITIMLAQHPDLENVEIQKKLRIKESELFRHDYYPSLYAFGITNVEDSRIPMGNFNWTIGLTVSYSIPVFRGSNVKDKMEQTKLRAKSLEETQVGNHQRLEAELKNNLLKLDDIRSRIKGNENIIGLAEENLTAAQMKYNIGKGSSLDVIDAQTILSTAKLNYNQIIIDFLTTVADINYNIGSDHLPFK